MRSFWWIQHKCSSVNRNRARACICSGWKCFKGGFVLILRKRFIFVLPARQRIPAWIQCYSLDGNKTLSVLPPLLCVWLSFLPDSLFIGNVGSWFLPTFSNTFEFIFTFTYFRTSRDKCNSVTKYVYRYYNISFTLTEVRAALDLYSHTWKEISYLLCWAIYLFC